jgi:hypothetical protein
MEIEKSLHGQSVASQCQTDMVGQSKVQTGPPGRRECRRCRSYWQQELRKALFCGPEARLIRPRCVGNPCRDLGATTVEALVTDITTIDTPEERAQNGTFEDSAAP